MSKHSEGPYSVHTYTECQGPHPSSDGGVHQAITIGAGRKMLGEVRMRTVEAGFPTIDNEAEMHATAALWIAAPDTLESLKAICRMQETFEGDAITTHVRLMHLCRTARAAIARAESAPC